MTAIVLASASPRRRVLLREAGLAFEVEPSDVDESLAGDYSAEAAATELARRKALAVAARHPARAAWIIGADTVVAVPVGSLAGPATVPSWRLLGKPEDAGEAAEMLGTLAGTTHVVATGVCVVDARSGASCAAAEVTRVTMRALSPDEIARYVASEEWRDKAGGYAIQETADAFVTALEGGGFDNVVGLPVRLTLELLARAGAPLPGPDSAR